MARHIKLPDDADGKHGSALTVYSFQVVTNQDLISPPKASVAEEHISLVSNMTSLAVPGELSQTNVVVDHKRRLLGKHSAAGWSVIPVAIFRFSARHCPKP